MSTEPAGGTISGNSPDTNTITDRQLFDQAVSSPEPTPSPAPSSDPASASAPSEAPASTRPDLQQQQPSGQPRNEQGQFAPRPKGQQQQEHRVPLRELMEERERRQRLEAHTQELTNAVLALQQQLMPRQQPQPQGPETIFDDPNAYLAQHVVNPLRNEGQMYMLHIKDGLSREMANQQFTTQAVNAALNDLASIRQTPQGTFVFNQIMQSGHPYGKLIEWHRQARAQAAIGADPQAWLRHQQQQWANDPRVQDHVMKLVQQRRANAGNGSAPGQPPNVQLPPSLSSTRSSSGRMQEVGDLSSASLYDFATK